MAWTTVAKNALVLLAMVQLGNTSPAINQRQTEVAASNSTCTEKAQRKAWYVLRILIAVPLFREREREGEEERPRRKTKNAMLTQQTGIILTTMRRRHTSMLCCA